MALSLLDVLRDPDQLLTLDEAVQGGIVRQARHAALLGYLEARISASDLPPYLADPLQSAKVHANYYDTQIKWEIHCVEQILDELEGPVILLKGAAYKALDLGLAKGRLASDVDLLLPKPQLNQAEALLIDAGWEPMKADAYEQHYYREWMHELPPLQHADRGTIVDLHHTILAPTARLKLDIGEMNSAALPLPNSALYTLCPEDNLLHRCTHLFFDGDMNNCLRELVDIKELLDHYLSQHSGQQLIDRALNLKLAKPLYCALYFSQKLLDAQIPDAWINTLEQRTDTISPLTRQMMEIQLRPGNLDTHNLKGRISGLMLFLRSHWLRMPTWMLLKHLARQAWARGGLRTGI